MAQGVTQFHAQADVFFVRDVDAQHDVVGLDPVQVVVVGGRSPNLVVQVFRVFVNPDALVLVVQGNVAVFQVNRWVFFEGFHGFLVGFVLAVSEPAGTEVDRLFWHILCFLSCPLRDIVFLFLE